MNQTLCMKTASSDMPSISLRKRKSRLKIRFLGYYEDKTLILTKAFRNKYNNQCKKLK